MAETTMAAGLCPRCGGVVGTWHTRPQCDAAYDKAYRAAMGSPAVTVHECSREESAANAAKWLEDAIRLIGEGDYEHARVWIDSALIWLPR